MISCIDVWDKPENIDFDKLLNQFVLKCTHDSGRVLICKDKNTFDKAKAIESLKNSMKYRYYYGAREWPNKNVERRIIAEPFIDSLGKLESVKYKVSTFGGKANFITICQCIAHSPYDDRTKGHYTL